MRGKLFKCIRTFSLLGVRFFLSNTPGILSKSALQKIPKADGKFLATPRVNGPHILFKPQQPRRFKASDWLQSSDAIVFRGAVGIFIPPLLANSCAREQKKREPWQIALAVTCWNLFSARFYRRAWANITPPHLVWANSAKNPVLHWLQSLFSNFGTLASGAYVNFNISAKSLQRAALIVRVCVREREGLFFLSA